ENASSRRVEIERRRSELACRFEGLAHELSRRRRKAADELSARVQTEARSLAMEHTVFQVRIEETSWSASGLDAVQFLVSANPGEIPRPIEKIASGGELSRIALTLKTCVRGGEQDRTLVF